MVLATPRAAEGMMDGWLETITEPLYGIVDLFLESPVSAMVMTLLFGAAVTGTLLVLR
jgi:hypothetical protein